MARGSRTDRFWAADEQKRKLLEEQARKLREDKANVATAGDMGLKDKFARAQLAQQNMTRAPKRGGVSISPRSFSAPVDGSAPEGRPASSFREATVPQTASVAGLWGAPRRVSQFQGEVTGLAKGSLLDRWGPGGLYSGAAAARRASALPDKAVPSEDIADYGPDKAVPSEDVADYGSPLSADPDTDFANYGAEPGPRIPAASGVPRVSSGLPAYAGASVSPTVESLMRGYTTYGSWSPEDQLDATNALARIRGEFYD
jgi:hypothetical protein